MPISESRRRANNKYNKEKVENIYLRVPMGRKAIIREHAKRHGESLNAFICRAVNEAMEKDGE